MGVLDFVPYFINIWGQSKNTNIVRCYRFNPYIFTMTPNTRGIVLDLVP